MKDKDPNDLIKEMQEIDPSGETLGDVPETNKVSPLMRALVVIVSGALIVAVVLVMRSFINTDNNEQAADPGLEVLTEGETPESGEISENDTPVLMPPYDPNTNLETSYITRNVVLDTIIPNRPRQDVSLYIVEEGDNVFGIAEKFGLMPESILWGNFETLEDNPREIFPGDKLNILPTDGIYHLVSQGETIASIADNFNITTDTIVDWPANDLDPYDTNVNSKLASGSWLIVPGGSRELKDWGPPAITRDDPTAAAYYGPGFCGTVYTGAVGSGVWTWPAPTRFLSGYVYTNIHRAIDIGGSVGDPIYAADTGVVVYAGWSNWGYGYLIVIDHGYGWQTAYAHLMEGGIYVSCGQSVYRGETIGGLGSTGNSSGPHLHFEMRHDTLGKVNPLEWIP